MKKLFLTLALAAFAFAANAQLTLGGNIGFDMTTQSSKSIISNKTTSKNGAVSTLFQFAPTVGWRFNNGKMEAGLSFGFAWNNTMYGEGYSDIDIITGAIGKVVEKANVLGFRWYVQPYFDWHFVSFGEHLSLFAEASVALGGTSYSGHYTIKNSGITSDIKAPTSSFNVDVAITPAIQYRFNRHFSMNLYVDIFRLYFASNTETTKVDDNNKYMNTNSTFGIGVSTNECQETLGLGRSNILFRFGFNYTF